VPELRPFLPFVPKDGGRGIRASGFGEPAGTTVSLNRTYSELQGLIGVVEEHLTEVPPMGKIELEEHLAPQRNVPPEIVPPGQASVDRVTELL
jgi:hypothetical protein